MRRWILLAAGLLLVTWLNPAQGTDVGELQPVELIQIYRQENRIVVETDTGDFGKGKSLKDALEDLEKSTPGTIFFHTAEYLLVTEGTKGLLPELGEMLRPGTQCCRIRGPVNGGKAAKYLTSHSPETTIHSVRYEKERMRMLEYAEGRFEFAE